VTDPFLPLLKTGIKTDLSRIRRLLAELGHPERRYRSILITGSNGKGTTTAVLESILRASGYRTGMLTSPHLVSVTERFRINGKPITLPPLQRFMADYDTLLDGTRATYFEATTACALWLFAKHKVDWGVLEIGMGGRWDACNAVDPELSIITSVSREHTQYLGRTVAQIAREKAQIVRVGKPVLVGEVGRAARSVLASEFRRLRALPQFMGADFNLSSRNHTAEGGEGALEDQSGSVDIRTTLLGRNALLNSALAAEAARSLMETGKATITTRDLQRGIAAAQWPARLQVIHQSPLVVIDVAHNAAAFAALCRDWKMLWPDNAPHVVVGLLEDKSPTPIARSLAQMAASVVVTTPDSPRAVSAATLARQWQSLISPVDAIPVIHGAIDLALRRAGKTGAVLICGSHFVAGPALRSLRRAGYLSFKRKPILTVA
jgi:dihydrofolate synthase/folylpolyglutamate synthase